jgi:PhnB protein
VNNSAVFLTFKGNCEQALKSYQKCFGGQLTIEYFDRKLTGFEQKIILRAKLTSESFTIIGSDLGHNEGLKVGNNIAIYLNCRNVLERQHFINNLVSQEFLSKKETENSALVEIIDAFEVHWIFEIDTNHN